jgi:hypothetical protein
MLGVGAGLSLGVWSFGVRGRVTPASPFTLFQGVLEVGIHPLRTGPWDPYVSVHGGYALVSMREHVPFAADSPEPNVAFPLPNAHGPEAGLSLGGDYYVSPLLSLGLDVTADAMSLSSPAAYFTEAGTGLPSVLVRNPVSGLGIGMSVSAHVGLHFDL